MTDSTRSTIVMGILLLGVLLSNGLHFMMPFDAMNPYEYLSGGELSSYQVLDIFIGGAIVPLVALATGFLMHAHRQRGIGNLAKVTGFVLAIGIVQAFFIFAFDFLPGLALMALVAVFFLKANWVVSLVSGMALFLFHLLANVLVSFFENIGSPTDIVYTAMQEVNTYTSVFRSADFFEIVALNIEIFSGNVMSSIYALVFTVLPWILVGIGLGQLGIGRFIRSVPVLHIMLFVILAGGGLALKMVQVLTLGTYSGRLLAENFGGPVLALGYFMLFTYMAEVMPARVMQIFDAVGRNILTIYILSNIILMFLFYGIGFGMYGETSVMTMLWIAVGIYIAMLLVGRLMERYRIRGLEYLFINNSENEINK